MNESIAVQRVIIQGAKCVEKSKFRLEIKNYNRMCGDFVSRKIKLPATDAQWWITVGKLDANNGMNIKLHLSRSKERVVDFKHLKFMFEATISGFNRVRSEWSTIPSSEVLFSTRVSNHLAQQADDLSIDMDLNISYFPMGKFSNNFLNPFQNLINVTDTLSKMRKDCVFSDFKFIVKGKEFKVQKCILAASSPVFARLFNSDMQEATENICKVENIEPEIFEILLEFIYAAKLPEKFSENAQDVFEAADYYDLQRLKEVCAYEILSQLTKENAVNLYCWAYNYDYLEQLKKESWECVKLDVLQKYYSLRDEPLSPEALKMYIEHMQAHQQFLDDFAEVPAKKRKLEDKNGFPQL